MQNKGLVRVFAIIFGLVCLYILSFTFIANNKETAAKEYAISKAGDNADERDAYERIYLDSIGKQNIFAGITYNEAKEKELNKGLDLKGGINVILQISVRDILGGLANGKRDPKFIAALDAADEAQKNSQNTYLDDFLTAFEAQGGDKNLADPDIFSNVILGDKVNNTMSNDEVAGVLREQVKETIKSAFETLRNRIDKFGVTQPNIQSLGDNGRILVELPGAKDIQRAVRFVTAKAQLEFYETHYAEDVYLYLLSVDQALAAKIKVEEEKEAAEVVQDSTENSDNVVDELLKDVEEDVEEAAAQASPLFDILKPSIQYREAARIAYAAVKDTAQINGYLRTPEMVRLRPANLRFAKFAWGDIETLPVPEGEDEEEGEEVVYLYALESNRSGEPAMSGDVVNGAVQQFKQTGEPAVGLDFEGQGIGQWAKLTRTVSQKRNAIAIVLDNTVQSAPTARQEIKGGGTEISGSFTVQSAQDLATVLNAGKLPASADVIEAEEIGATLGKEAINSGVISFIIALVLVLIWMVFYYGKAGLFADIALIVNILFIFGVLASIKAVLTLPGIAGIVLTIGMSVDANVLIFERIKEELRKGKSQKDAIKDGFNNALSSILDANITTFLTALILFLFGTGPVQGFATTLMIGIATSLFSAIFITRLFIDNYGKNGKSLEFATGMTKNLFANTKIDFLGKRKIAYIISTALVAIGIFSLVTGGLNAGVDFVGGRSYTVRFEKAMNSSEVGELLASDAVFGSAIVKTYGADNQLKITTKYRIQESGLEVDEAVEQKLYEALKTYLPADLNFADFSRSFDGKEIGKMSYNKVGPTIADDIKRGALFAVIGSLIVVFLYILLRFRRWQFSLGAVAAVFHDVLLVLGIFAIFKNIMPFDMEVDQNFIAAILTVIGYSLNDTVVVFDRIREYIKEHGSTRGFGKLINQALNSTLSRTLNTSVTTLIVLLAIFFLGADSIRGLMFALIVGVIVGTYSSLFIATPVMFDTVQKKALKEEKKEEETEEA
ncbi:protein translocase subunit SecDF [Dokdonia pacifica]|uniref:Multifunctional fusion protein n=1 Tax=Dokdonia pacifica TaxID=1627892 RepID=A0A239BB16_9FLAO|nr:protein translocase subunit SecDF [Dokdonia pacifica]GGG30299.1 protein translocase subunit SecDF [Dokdonia pacifica]SNS05137.1 protein translocase subunit secF /protein translocase subunit secD [Dokdonia pacifica]